MSKKLKNSLLFMSVFANELVDVLYNVIGEAVTYQAYVIDSDDLYIYMGTNPNEIEFVLQHENIVHIEIHSEDRLYQQILEETPNEDMQ